MRVLQKKALMCLCSLAFGDVRGDVDDAMCLPIRLSVEHAPITREPANLTIRFRMRYSAGKESCLSIKV